MAPSTTAVPNTTTTGAPPAAPEVWLRILPNPTEVVIELEGEPGARYEITVASAVQTREGRLDRRGRAEERFTVDEGEHEVRVRLANVYGRSELVTKSLAINAEDDGGSRSRVTTGIAVVSLAVAVAWWRRRRGARVAPAAAAGMPEAGTHRTRLESSGSTNPAEDSDLSDPRAVVIVQAAEELSWPRKLLGALVWQAWEPERRTVYDLTVVDEAGEERGRIRVRGLRQANDMKNAIARRASKMTDEEIRECHKTRAWERMAW